MIKKLLNRLGTTLYVQIWEKRIKVTDIVTGNIYDEEPLIAITTNEKGKKTISAVGNNAGIKTGENIEFINPFSHPRVLFSDFNGGEKVLQHAFQALLAGKFLTPSPVVVVHPMEKIEGGLTTIEDRAFRELAFGAGARDAIIYEGPELPIHGFDFEEIKSEYDTSR